MPADARSDVPPITQLLRRAAAGDRAALDEVYASLYPELKRIARSRLRQQGRGDDLGTTTLLHEAYLNIAGRGNVAFVDRPRFLAYASRAMRGLVIDYARRRRAKKRGRQFEITLDDQAPMSREAMQKVTELERLGEALDELAEIDPALAELVDLHFFSGFSFGEIAELRRVSERTVYREWRKARIVLHHALLRDDAPSPNEST